MSGAGLEPRAAASATLEEAVSSTGPCIGEVGDTVLLELEAGECFWLHLLSRMLPLPPLTPWHPWEREGSASHLLALRFLLSCCLVGRVPGSSQVLECPNEGCYPGTVPVHHIAIHRWLP